ncbi:hypothetical protein C8Q78DRAFT_1125919 [Trametes maxima]|nr:hypothetical protein C8Q78DRAFT_1125919 [Trametes maxima]
MEIDVQTRKVTPSLRHYHEQARHLARIVSPFMRPADALIHGKYFSFEDESDGESDSDESDLDKLSSSGHSDEEQSYTRAERQELKYQYNALLETIPDLKTDIKLLDEDGLTTLGDYLNSRLKAARGTDGGLIRDEVVRYLYYGGLETFRDAPDGLDKFRRGWYNEYTARMLCPQNQLARFDANREKFCEMILNGPEDDDEGILSGGNFPSLLYDQELADPGDKLKGLLRSPYFLALFKSLWTGPKSVTVIGGRKDKTSGKPPIAWKYGMTQVTPRSLAYTAVQVRYELTHLMNFATTDVGGYDGFELFEEIVGLFEDPHFQWCKDTLAWWNKYAYSFRVTLC